MGDNATGDDTDTGQHISPLATAAPRPAVLMQVQHVAGAFQEQYQELVAEVQRLRVQNAKLSAAGDFAVKLETLQAERSSLWEQVSQLRAENCKLVTEDHELAAKLQELAATNQRLHDTIAGLQATVSDQTARITEQDARITEQDARIAVLECQQQADQATVVKAQLAMCFQSKAARFVDPHWRDPTKEHKACFVKVGQLLTRYRRLDAAPVAALAGRLHAEGLTDSADFADIDDVQVLFDSLASPRHALAHPTHHVVSDVDVQRIVDEDGGAELAGLHNVCKWLTRELGDAGVLDIPH